MLGTVAFGAEKLPTVTGDGVIFETKHTCPKQDGGGCVLIAYQT